MSSGYPHVTSDVNVLRKKDNGESIHDVENKKVVVNYYHYDQDNTTSTMSGQQHKLENVPPPCYKYLAGIESGFERGDVSEEYLE